MEKDLRKVSKNNREQIRYRKIFLYISAVFVCFILAIGSISYARWQGYTKIDLVKSISQLKEENERILLGIEQKSSLDYIERKASEELNMKKNAEIAEQKLNSTISAEDKAIKKNEEIENNTFFSKLQQLLKTIIILFEAKE
ncbi:MAG: hypothetical protein WCI30_05535 [Clostridia bacterium]